jgi:hypothetical protein
LELNTVVNVVSEGMVATLEAVWAAGHAVFGPACYHHGLITEHGWSSLKVASLRGAGEPGQVDGVSGEAALLAWLAGERVSSAGSWQSTLPAR